MAGHQAGSARRMSPRRHRGRPPRRRIREPGGSRPSRPRPADHDRPSRSLGGRRDGLVFGRRGRFAEPRTYGVVCGGIPGRIGQPNEPTSPSRPRPADHDRRSASLEGGGETGWSSRSLGAVPRTYPVVRRMDGVVVWQGIADSAIKRGSVIRSAHKHSRAGLWRQDSAEQSFPAVPGTYAVLQCGIPGRIGQTNEHTAPSPPLPPIREESANPAADLAHRHDRRSGSSEGGGETSSCSAGFGGRSAPRTDGVVREMDGVVREMDGVVVWRGIAAFATKRGAQ